MAVWLGIVWLLLALPGGWALGTARRSRKRAGGTDWTEPIAALLIRTGLYRRIRPALQGPHRLLSALGGGTCPPETLQRWTAGVCGTAYLALLAGLLLAAVAASPALAVLAAIVAASVPAIRWRELRAAADRRRAELLRELPALSTRLAVMVSAGETVLRALERCAEGQRHPLYVELGRALEAMRRGEPTATALEEFGRRCGGAEARRLAGVLTIHLRRGGESLSAALREQSRVLWEQRKAAARTAGEQASSRLAFPLAVLLLIVLALVGAPSLFLMGI